ncbi:MAG: MBL fold metallo-hydrolase [Candidatus Lumbricidophila eiseniae]|uniref:MBL fold metallo-hydrolase n=1 Tax=Candidatus Lumbricidiphila eiseniae TaxID=1969409 RepID=A0A2A6FTI8_9MICO|nr:MAG: MBL fold metallo-hydrolase [Candidatus Lumbricidophila eiseniae]
MRITKLEHSTFVVEELGSKLIVDPGGFTPPLADLTHVAAVVLTHEHSDHWSNDHLDRISAANPGVSVYGPAGVAAAAARHLIITVSPGDEAAAGPFHLRFFGGTHALIHRTIPLIDNIGVLINDRIFYGGDSLEVPDVPVEVLAAPLGAPWMKISEGMDFAEGVCPRQAFGVHEGVLSPLGVNMSHTRLAWAVEQGGGTYYPLAAGDSLELTPIDR